MRATLTATATLALVACNTASLGTAPTRTTVNVAGEAIAVAAPPGFCIDSESTSVTEAGAFVLMSHCALLGGGGEPVGAALTTSISTGGLFGEGDDPVQTMGDLKDFVGTGEGRAMLGRSGQAGSVRVLSTLEQGDVLYVLVEDRGQQPVAGIDRRFWRAFLEVEDRIVVLSVLGFEGAGVSSQDSLNLLASLATSLQRQNGV